MLPFFAPRRLTTGTCQTRLGFVCSTLMRHVCTSASLQVLCPPCISIRSNEYITTISDRTSCSAPVGAMQVSIGSFIYDQVGARDPVITHHPIAIRLPDQESSITLRVRINDPPCGADSAARLSNSTRSRRDRQDYPARCDSTSEDIGCDSILGQKWILIPDTPCGNPKERCPLMWAPLSLILIGQREGEKKKGKSRDGTSAMTWM